ncbi:hypothetical protein CH063_14308, partial [Colletotrichum higginsianum]
SLSPPPFPIPSHPLNLNLYLNCNHITHSHPFLQLMSAGPANETTSLLLPPRDPRPDDGTTTTTAAHEETMSSQAFWRVGAVFGAAAVGIGAFGAHGLKGRISDPAKIASWSTAA